MSIHSSMSTSDQQPPGWRDTRGGLNPAEVACFVAGCALFGYSDIARALLGCTHHSTALLAKQKGWLQAHCYLRTKVSRCISNSSSLPCVEFVLPLDGRGSVNANPTKRTYVPQGVPAEPCRASRAQRGSPSVAFPQKRSCAFCFSRG